MFRDQLLTAAALAFDCQQEIQRLSSSLRQILRDDLHRQGFVIGLSGGVDSSVAAALCVAALGRQRVFAVLMPEQHSSAETRTLSRSMAAHLGIAFCEQDITATLAAVGCYDCQTAAIRKVVPEFQPDWQAKIVLPGICSSARYRLFSLVVRDPDGHQLQVRLSPEAYRELVAATNYKQRVRKMLEYYHADRLNYAVIGTPNRLEYDQGFFVKNGDGAADVKPIAHLYKTQVYALAAALDVPEQIRSRPPSTDTYSMAQTQEEFYFSLPYEKMDLCLYGRDHGLTAAQVAPAVGLTAAQVEHVYLDIDGKRRASRYQHLEAQLLGEPGAAAVARRA